MKQLPAALIVVPLFLVACSKTPLPEEIITKVHERYSTVMASALDQIKLPIHSDSAFSLHILTLSGQTLIPGNAKVLIETSRKNDVSDVNNLSMEGHVGLSADVSFPAALISQANANASELQRVIAALEMDIKLVSNMLFFNLGETSLEMIGPLASSTKLSQDIKDKWFGTLPNELKANSGSLNLAQSLLADVYPSERFRKALRNFVQNCRILKGTNVSRVTSDTYEVDVELDKESLERSMRTLISDISSGSTVLSDNGQQMWSDFGRELNNLTNSHVETLKGTLIVNRSSYEVRAFNGDVLSSDGKPVGRIAFQNDQNTTSFRVMSASGTELYSFNRKDNEYKVREKGNSTVSLSIGTGILLEVFDEASESTVVRLMLTRITSGEETRMSGSLLFPQAGLRMNIHNLVINGTTLESTSMALSGTVVILGDNLMDISMTSSHREVPTLGITVPETSGSLTEMGKKLSQFVKQLTTNVQSNMSTKSVTTVDQSSEESLN